MSQTWEEMEKMMKENWARVERKDTEAKAKGKMVGRYIQHGHADGDAYYEIVKENKNTIGIKVITGIGDDWVLPAWGERATIDKRFAFQCFSQRDVWANLAKGMK